MVYLQDHGPRSGRTQDRYDLIAVEKARPGQMPLLINMDAQAPNKVFGEWAERGSFRPDLTLLRPETAWGSSRFDFYYETAGGTRGFVEVKGVTLERGACRVSDAPTERGVRHLEELARAVGEGYAAHVCFVVQMAGISGFCPNERTHPAFGRRPAPAAEAGVEVQALECAVTPDSLWIQAPIPLSFFASSNFVSCINTENNS